jgi:hypothetical protein
VSKTHTWTSNKTHNFVTFYEFLIHLGVHHTACIEGLVKISIYLPLGGWLGGHLVINKTIAVITVIVFFLESINTALFGLKVRSVKQFPMSIINNSYLRMFWLCLLSFFFGSVLRACRTSPPDACSFVGRG